MFNYKLIYGNIKKMVDKNKIMFKNVEWIKKNKNLK